MGPCRLKQNSSNSCECKPLNTTLKQNPLEQAFLTLNINIAEDGRVMNTVVSLFPCQQSSHSTSVTVCFCWHKMVLLLQPLSKRKQQPWSPVTELKITLSHLLRKVQCSNCTHLHCTVMFLQAVNSKYIMSKRIPSNLYTKLKYKKVTAYFILASSWTVFPYLQLWLYMGYQEHFTACDSRHSLFGSRRTTSSDLQCMHILQTHSTYCCTPCNI